MISQSNSLHQFKRSNLTAHNFSKQDDKFSHILFRFVPGILFKSNNVLLSLFANGIAVLLAKIASHNSYAETYFDINSK